MAKFMLELEDMPDGRLRVAVKGDGLADWSSLGENTATQNAAILMIGTLRSVGIGGNELPDLCPSPNTQEKD